MDLVLNRRGGVPLRDQLVTQIELRILAGAYGPGARLPSVRALARRLDLHPNTVSAAYKDLEAAGHVRLRRGSGVFVNTSGPPGLAEARGLDEMIRVALHAAFGKGYSGAEVRVAVERWLAAAPPDRVVAVDPSRQMAELMAHEASAVLPLRVDSCDLERVERDPAALSGALALCLPYHVETLKRLAPSAAIEVVNLEVPEPDRVAVQALPAGAIVLVVSHSPTVLPFASVFIRSLRGDEIVVEAFERADTRGWRRLVRVADLVFADALCVEVVRRARPKRMLESRLLVPSVLEQLAGALSIVVPRISRQG